MAVSGSGDDQAQATLNAWFPTSGLAVIDFKGSLRNAAPGKGRLEAFFTPADL